MVVLSLGCLIVNDALPVEVMWMCLWLLQEVNASVSPAWG